MLSICHHFRNQCDAALIESMEFNYVPKQHYKEAKQLMEYGGISSGGGGHAAVSNVTSGGLRTGGCENHNYLYDDDDDGAYDFLLTNTTAAIFEKDYFLGADNEQHFNEQTNEQQQQQQQQARCLQQGTQSAQPAAMTMMPTKWPPPLPPPHPDGNGGGGGDVFVCRHCQLLYGNTPNGSHFHTKGVCELFQNGRCVVGEGASGSVRIGLLRSNGPVLWREGLVPMMMMMGSSSASSPCRETTSSPSSFSSPSSAKAEVPAVVKWVHPLFPALDGNTPPIVAVKLVTVPVHDRRRLQMTLNEGKLLHHLRIPFATMTANSSCGGGTNVKNATTITATMTNGGLSPSVSMSSGVRIDEGGKGNDEPRPSVATTANASKKSGNAQKNNSQSGKKNHHHDPQQPTTSPLLCSSSATAAATATSSPPLVNYASLMMYPFTPLLKDNNGNNNNVITTTSASTTATAATHRKGGGGGGGGGGQGRGPHVAALLTVRNVTDDGFLHHTVDEIRVPSLPITLECFGIVKEGKKQHHHQYRGSKQQEGGEGGATSLTTMTTATATANAMQNSAITNNNNKISLKALRKRLPHGNLAACIDIVPTTSTPLPPGHHNPYAQQATPANLNSSSPPPPSSSLSSSSVMNPSASMSLSASVSMSGDHLQRHNNSNAATSSSSASSKRRFEQLVASVCPHRASFILEYCDGGTLQHYVEKLGALPPKHASALFFPIVLGLDHLHNVLRTIHRDIKPSNILLCREDSGVNARGPFLESELWRVKLADFGIAKSDVDAKTVCGTRTYMAPEVRNMMLMAKVTDKPSFVHSRKGQIFTGNRTKYGLASDIFSLGVVLQFMLSGGSSSALGAKWLLHGMPTSGGGVAGGASSSSSAVATSSSSTMSPFAGGNGNNSNKLASHFSFWHVTPTLVCECGDGSNFRHEKDKADDGDDLDDSSDSCDEDDDDSEHDSEDEIKKARDSHPAMNDDQQKQTDDNNDRRRRRNHRHNVRHALHQCRYQTAAERQASGGCNLCGKITVSVINLCNAMTHSDPSFRPTLQQIFSHPFIVDFLQQHHVGWENQQRWVKQKFHPNCAIVKNYLKTMNSNDASGIGINSPHTTTVSNNGNNTTTTTTTNCGGGSNANHGWGVIRSRKTIHPVTLQQQQHASGRFAKQAQQGTLISLFPGFIFEPLSLSFLSDSIAESSLSTSSIRAVTRKASALLLQQQQQQEEEEASNSVKGEAVVAGAAHVYSAETPQMRGVGNGASPSSLLSSSCSVSPDRLRKRESPARHHADPHSPLQQQQPPARAVPLTTTPLSLNNKALRSKVDGGGGGEIVNVSQQSSQKRRNGANHATVAAVQQAQPPPQRQQQQTIPPSSTGSSAIKKPASAAAPLVVSASIVGVKSSSFTPAAGASAVASAKKAAVSSSQSRSQQQQQPTVLTASRMVSASSSPKTTKQQRRPQEEVARPQRPLASKTENNTDQSKQSSSFILSLFGGGLL